MTKDSAKVTAVDAGLNTHYFTWKELSKLNKPHNAHVAYRGKVYDVSSFVSQHPGGHDQIMLGAGRDITVIFDTHHPLGTPKVLEKYYVGELIDNEHPVFPEMGQFYKTVRKRVDQFFKDQKIDPKIDNWMAVRYIIICFLYFFFQFCMVYYHDFIPLAVTSALLAGAFAANISLTLSHDASHFSFTHKPWIWKLLGSANDFFLGISQHMWLHQHLIGHHPYTNIESSDPDLYTGKDDHKKDWRRWKYSQQWFKSYNYQHLWLPLVYGLLIIRLRISDIHSIITLRYKNIRINPLSNSQLFIFWGGKVFWLFYHIFLPLWFKPTLTMIILLLIVEICSGYYLGFVVLVSHVNDSVERLAKPDKDNFVAMDWAEMQIKFTTDYAEGSWFWHVFSASINQHKSHHIIPYVLQSHIPKMVPIVKETCKEFGLAYKTTPTAKDALANHISHIRKLGENYQIKA